MELQTLFEQERSCCLNIDSITLVLKVGVIRSLRGKRKGKVRKVRIERKGNVIVNRNAGGRVKREGKVRVRRQFHEDIKGNVYTC